MGQTQILVRRSVRHDVSIRGVLSIAPEHTGMVLFGPNSGAKDGWIECDCVDFSLGGVGVMAQVFVPRLARVHVKLFSAGEEPRPVLEATCVVRRTIMTDRRPMYNLGCSFIEMTESSQRQVERLMTLLSSEA
ncbi:MAG TPA: PilZ domain-containing protein [Phycisphaerales bacterium]|nr:PilZ domain-containing protein [Phycisphaerales bacterium]